MQHQPAVPVPSASLSGPRPPAPAALTGLRGEQGDWAVDLRRAHRRGHVETMITRAESAPIPPEELSLLRAAYVDGRTAIEIASIALAASASAPPTRAPSSRAVRRRLRTIARRVTSPLFLFVLRHRDTWPPARRKVANACVLQGLSLRETARMLGLSLYNVRRHHGAILALFESIAHAPMRRSA